VIELIKPESGQKVEDILFVDGGYCR